MKTLFPDRRSVAYVMRGISAQKDIQWFTWRKTLFIILMLSMPMTIILRMEGVQAQLRHRKGPEKTSYHRADCLWNDFLYCSQP